MKRRVFAALLACAMVLSLAACGGGNGGGSSSNPGSGSDVSAAVPGGSSSQPDASNPDSSQPDASNDVPAINFFLTLNKTEVTLKKAGATFKLNWTVNPVVQMLPTFTSSDETVAKVDDQGKITAVAPGTAVITVEQSNITDAATGKSLSAACTVTCDWKEETKPEPKPDPEPKPEPKPDPKPDASNPGGGSSSSGDSSGSSGSSSSQVDLSSFYSTITGKYQFSFMTEADDATLSNFFAGLSDLSLSQQVIYLCGMLPAPNGDFALVQVKDSKDVDTVKSIFQARIDYMVGDGNGPGGAWYPGPTEMWENQSRIVANGDYVMLIAHESCDDIVKEFNALF